MNENHPPEAPAPKASKRRLLPGVVTHPLTLLIAIVVPQLILLVLNLRSYHLMSGEVTEFQLQLAALLFAAELVMLVGGFALMFWLWRRSEGVPWSCNLLIFVPPIVYLAFSSMKIHEIVPDSLQLWIVEPQKLIFYQFVFLMPATFLAALRLACFPMRTSRGKDVGISLGLAIGIPVFWYLALQVGRGMWMEGLPGTLIFIIVM